MVLFLIFNVSQSCCDRARVLIQIVSSMRGIFSRVRSSFISTVAVGTVAGKQQSTLAGPFGKMFREVVSDISNSLMAER